MAGFDFKSEIKRSVKRKRGLLKEVAMKLDPKDPSNKVLIGDEEYGFSYDERSGVVDRGQTDRSERIQKKITALRRQLKGFTQIAGGRNKKSKTISRITRYLSRLDTYVDDFKEEYFQENYEKQKELMANFKEDLGSPRKYKLKTTDYENPATINQIQLSNFMDDVRKVWLNARNETQAGGLLNINTQRLKYRDTFKLTPEVQKQADVVATKRAAAGKTKAQADIAATKKAAAAKAGTAPEEAKPEKVAAGKHMTVAVDEKNQIMFVLFEPADRSVYKNSGPVKRLSPNGLKQLFADEKQENSFINLMIKQLAKSVGVAPLEAEEGVDDRWKVTWSLKALKEKGVNPQKYVAALTDSFYKKVYAKAAAVAKTIKGGEEEGGEGWFDKLEKFGGVDQTGAYEDVYGPMEESNILEFEKTLQGLKLEKLHNKLMPKQKRLNEQFGGWDAPAEAVASAAGEGAISSAQKQAMRAAYQTELVKRGASEGSFSFGDYLQYKYGAKAGAGILRKLGSGAASIGRGALSATKYVFSPAALSALKVWGGQTASLSSAAGVGGVASALAASAAIGVGIGMIINWAISGTSLDSSKDRINDAKDNPQYADWMLEMFSTGKGRLCGPNAEDGWQVKCAGTAGGFKQEDSAGGWDKIGRTAKGWFSEAREYADPVGWRDLVQTKGSFSKEDLLEILAYMAILYGEDKKAGLVKTVEKKTKDGKAVSIVLQSGSKMLKYKYFYLRDVNAYAGVAFGKRDKKIYEMVTLALDPDAVVAELRGAPTGKPTGAEEKAKKAAAKDADQVKELQKAFIEFFGPELEAKFGDEYTQGIIGNNTRYAYSQFSKMFKSDPDFPKGKNKLKKLPDFIRQSIVDKELRAAAADTSIDLEKEIAESKIDLQQKRLLEMNKRLMKF